MNTPNQTTEAQSGIIQASHQPVTVAHGDGIGPEIMEATLRILKAAGARLDIETIEIGAKAYEAGHGAGIPDEAWESILRTKLLLKAPITTPQGGGYKSLNVTMRKALGLYANVRPCISYAPFVPTKNPGMDMVIIRENEEDLYAGIEHRQTPDTYQCLKLMTRPGCEKIVRYAFAYARHAGRRKVTCLIKDNIMKLTDGLFHAVFDEVAKEYPEIESNHLIIDIGAARIADTPELFDVVVVPNLYGDIVSDIAAQVAGSVGLAGSANIGEHAAMFEAIHGSAPDIAGKDIANPSGLLQAAILLLGHVGQADIADLVQNAWLLTIEEGIHTADIYQSATSQRKVGTQEFADAVIERLGKLPRRLHPVDTSSARKEAMPLPRVAPLSQPRPVKTMDGVDVFLEWTGGSPAQLGGRLAADTSDSTLQLSMISNRGMVVWPGGFEQTFCVDHWRCRFLASQPGSASHADVLALLNRLTNCGYDFIKTEGLYRFDGKPGYSAGQGQ